MARLYAYRFDFPFLPLHCGRIDSLCLPKQKGRRLFTVSLKKDSKTIALHFLAWHFPGLVHLAGRPNVLARAVDHPTDPWSASANQYGVFDLLGYVLENELGFANSVGRSDSVWLLPIDDVGTRA